MKTVVLLTVALFYLAPIHINAQGRNTATPDSSAENTNLYIDVHQLEPGKVKYEDVAGAHAKDLAVEKKYGVHFISYWVDEEKGLVYCLSRAGNKDSIVKTHAEAHGLLPDYIYKVTGGTASALNAQTNFFIDVHHFGAGNVTAKDVAAAHQKDLAVEKKHGVNFINYWVDEKEGERER